MCLTQQLNTRHFDLEQDLKNYTTTEPNTMMTPLGLSSRRVFGGLPGQTTPPPPLGPYLQILGPPWDASCGHRTQLVEQRLDRKLVLLVPAWAKAKVTGVARLQCVKVTGGGQIGT